MTNTKPIRVMIVDDSPVVQQLLFKIFSLAPDIYVAGIANNGEEALTMLSSAKPDVITMDMRMPGMNGLEATRRILETYPVPVVIVTASKNAHEVASSFQAMGNGALAVLEKPPGVEHPNFKQACEKLIATVKSVSEIKVVRRRLNSSQKRTTPRITLPVREQIHRPEVEIVGIGSSTGGPPVLQKILTALPEKFPIPLVIVQHIARGFSDGLVEWLNSSSRLPVRLAREGERLQAGYCYLAPDDAQMKIDGSRSIRLTDDPPENGVRPSVSYLFRSLSRGFGSRAAGVLLSGMGRDGAVELKQMREKGGFTIAQDRASSVVHGMPGEAIKMGAAMYVVSDEEIAPLLIKLIFRSHKMG